MKPILCVALNPAIDMSCDADRVQPTLKVRTRNPMEHPGGGGVNVARVVAELGGDAALAWLSGGTTGLLFDGLVAGSGFALHRFPMSGAVRIAYMVHEVETNFEYRFVPEGPVVSVEELEPILAFCESFDTGYVVASGSLPRGAPADCYARLARAAETRGIRFVLDTSGPALAETLATSRVFLVKPSLGELEKLVGARLDEKEAADAALALVRDGKAENVALTMGTAGAMLASADGVLRLPSIRVKVLSAVGSGDSFVAAMVTALSRGADVQAAFRFGIAAGSAAAMTAGTQLCRRADVERLFAQISG